MLRGLARVGVESRRASTRKQARVGRRRRAWRSRRSFRARSRSEHARAIAGRARARSMRARRRVGALRGRAEEGEPTAEARGSSREEAAVRSGREGPAGRSRRRLLLVAHALGARRHSRATISARAAGPRRRRASAGIAPGVAARIWSAMRPSQLRRRSQAPCRIGAVPDAPASGSASGIRTSSRRPAVRRSGARRRTAEPARFRDGMQPVVVDQLPSGVQARALAARASAAKAVVGVLRGRGRPCSDRRCRP